MRTVLITTGLAAAVAAQNASSPCVTGDAVHMIVARASLEAPGQGILANVSSRITEQLPGSNAVAVDYPATLNNYQSSEGQGVAAMMMLVTSYASQCPNSKMVLMGYSQGAQVAADVLCGTMENNFNTTQALDASITDKVAAVVLMGDPSKAANETFLQGTSTKDGVFPRTNTAACDAVKSRMVSFCNANDTFCDSGNSLEVHLSYVQDNGTAAVDFVVQKAKGAAAAPAGGASPAGKSNVTTTSAAASDLHWSSKALTGAFGVMSLALAFILAA